MYSQAYSSGVCSYVPGRLSMASSTTVNSFGDRFGVAWEKSIKSGSDNCGRIVSNIVQNWNMNMNRNGQNSSLSIMERDDSHSVVRQESYLKDLVSLASSILFICDFSLWSISDDKEYEIMNPSVIQSIMADARKLLPGSHKTDIPTDFAHITRKRDLGYQALMEAFSMLEGELVILAS
jgi:hypothetical protein